MKKLRTIRALALAAVQLLAGNGTHGESCASPTAPSSAARPNVILVVIDDMAWEDLYFGEAPNLVGLMQRGRVYRSFYTHPVCTPSRVGLNFGLYASRFGITSALDPTSKSDRGIPVEHLSLGSAMHAAGYATACFGKWHMNASEAHQSELARVFGHEHWHAGNPANLGKDESDSQYDWVRIDDGAVATEPGYASERVVAAFEAWWKEPEQRPRFAVVNLFTPHEPFSVPPPPLAGSDVASYATPRARFEAAVRAVDSLVGRIAASIDVANTHLMVFPDNGTPGSALPPTMWHHGYKLTCWQGGVHVPMVALGPGVVRGTSDHLVHILDVPRTVLDLCDAYRGCGFEDARSFATSLFGDQPPREPLVVQYAGSIGTSERVLSSFAVVDSDGWKLVRMNGESTLFHLPSDPRELYVVDDPERRRKLAAVEAALTR